PIIARTHPIFKAEKTNGKELGIRTRLNTEDSRAAYERISSIDSGSTEVSPRSVFTSTGKKHRTAAIVTFDHGLRIPNHAFVIGANAMIGTAFAAIMYGISASPKGRQRARARALTKAALLPRTNPPNASLNVIHAPSASCARSSQSARITSENLGTRKLWTCKASGRSHCQATM